MTFECRSGWMRFCIFFWTCFFQASAFAKEIEIPKIIKNGNISDLLNQDPVLHNKVTKISADASSGNFGTQLQEQHPLNFTDFGKPGTAFQYRGFSSSAEATNVTALGISLNPVAGGGFDFSTLPQFLWTDFKFSLLNSGAAINPQANGGNIDLKLWTEEAKNTEVFGLRGTILGTSNKLYQTTASGKSNGVAALVGISSGRIVGPAGSFSVRINNQSIFTPKVHLIASEQQAKSPGSSINPTPLDQTKSTRIIPVFSLDSQLTSQSILKSNFYYDFSKIAFHSTFFGDSDNKSYSLGMDHALWSDGFKAALGVKQARFKGTGVTYPTEEQGTLQVGKTVAESQWTIDPVFQLLGVSQFGVFPQGSLGLRLDLNQAVGVFTRVGYANRFPSFYDRYVNFIHFVRNPDLKKERSKTLVLGLDYSIAGLKQTVQGYGQWRADSYSYQPSSFRVNNEGDSYVFGVLSDTELEIVQDWTLSNHIAYANSKLNQTQKRTSYLPTWANSVSLKAKPIGAPGRLEGELSARFSGAVSIPGSSTPLGGYSYFNGGISVQLLSSENTLLRSSLRVENLFDRQIEFTKDYPSEGRVWIGSVTGSI